MTPSGCVHLAFHPAADSLVLAAAVRGHTAPPLSTVTHSLFPHPCLIPLLPALYTLCHRRMKGLPAEWPAPPLEWIRGVFAQDKGGHIGLWHVDRECSPAAAEVPPPGSGQGAGSGAAEGDDALFDLTPHYSYICGLRCPAPCPPFD